MRIRHLIRAGLLGVAAKTWMFAQQPPERVTVCQLEQNPAAYDQKRVEVNGFVSFSFENFHLFDPGCAPSEIAVWLDYGGSSRGTRNSEAATAISGAAVCW